MVQALTSTCCVLLLAARCWVEEMDGKTEMGGVSERGTHGSAGDGTKPDGLQRRAGCIQRDAAIQPQRSH